MEKILIIKTGYSEVLDNPKDSYNPSLGDVLRTTPILHAFKEDDVTWLTDEAAFPLLEGNPYINRLLHLDFTNAMQLLDEDDFDAVINLEKNHDICKFSNKIPAWKKYGFRFDKKTLDAKAYDRGIEVLTVSSDIPSKKLNTKCVQKLLFEMVGKEWNGEGYILGYQPKNKEIYDVGLNTQIGKKWPNKSWPIKKWDGLEKKLIGGGIKVTRQETQPPEILNDLRSYIDWINSCKLIVSNDSLGLHLALALNKKVLGLFGPTSGKEVYFYGNGKGILPNPIQDCMPCLIGTCEKEINCMEDISIERVHKEIKSYLK